MPRLALVLAVAIAVAAGEPPPNIVLILTDDQGWADCSVNGNRQLDTPNLARLAREGAALTRFYVSPLCAPTRAALLTGRWPQRGGIAGVSKGKEFLDPDETTIADLLAARGYATGCFGKWHNGDIGPYHPLARGFQHFTGFCGGHWRCWDAQLEQDGADLASRGHLTDVLTDAALAFIDANRARPFFCYLPYNAPHSPFHVHKALFEKYRAKGLDERAAAIYGMCEGVDNGIGRILQRLDEHGLNGRTLVVFLTDNGPSGARPFTAGLRGAKGSADEGGMRVPCFARLPGAIPPGLVVDRIAAHVDWLPTLVDLAGAAAPTRAVDGRSLLPLLRGAAGEWPDRVLFENGAARSQRWTWLAGKGALFDIAADPGQAKDVAPEHPAEAARLAAAHAAWKQRASGRAFDGVARIGHARVPRDRLRVNIGQLAGAKASTGWTDACAVDCTAATRLGWDIEVLTAGTFALRARYLCPAEPGGLRFAASIAGRAAAGPAALTAGVPVFAADQLCITRAEADAEPPWATAELGEITVPAGRGRAELHLEGAPPPGLRVYGLELVRR